MNVASLELCRELYELSGWGKSAFSYHIHDGLQKYFIYSDGSNPPYIVDGTAYSLSEDERAGEHTPAYSLGYLVRKLPSYWEIHPARNRYVAANFNGIVNSSSRAIKHVCIEDTPEDAAAKLAIELFKQGVLKREGA